jgi:hypothetical protein
VTGSAGSPGPQRQACVVVWPTNPTTFTGGTQTDANGQYVVRGLAAGRYKVYLSDPACDYLDQGMPDVAPQWYRDQASQPTAT